MHFCCSAHPGQGWCGKCSLINWIMLLPEQHVSAGMYVTMDFVYLYNVLPVPSGSWSDVENSINELNRIVFRIRSCCVLCFPLLKSWELVGIGQPVCRALSFPPPGNGEDSKSTLILWSKMIFPPFGRCDIYWWPVALSDVLWILQQ